jgi:hypothetical protein
MRTKWAWVLRSVFTSLSLLSAIEIIESMSPAPDCLEVLPDSSRDSEICIRCGFCCDGTLFNYGAAGLTETAETLINIGVSPLTDDHGSVRGFRQPCPHFAEKCSIYSSPRPSVCGAFRCRLLRLVDKGKYTADQAQQIVADTRSLREVVLPELDRLEEAVGGVNSLRNEQSLLGRITELLPSLIRGAGAEFGQEPGRSAKAAMTLFLNLRRYFVRLRQ